MFRQHRANLEAVLSAEGELYRQARFNLVGIAGSAPSPEATGDAKASGTSFSLTYGDYVTRQPPIVFVYTSLPSEQPSLPDLIDLERREFKLPAAKRTVQAVSISIHGERYRVEQLRAGPLWGAEVMYKATVVTLVANGWEPALIDLETIEDIQPYLSGRRKLVERLWHSG
jgi:hypothetical protein